MGNIVRDDLTTDLYDPLLSVVMSKDEFNEIVLSTTVAGSGNFLEVIKDRLSTIFSDEEKTLNVLNTYIDTFFNFSNSGDVIFQFNLLRDYLNKYDCFLDPYVIGNLITINTKFNDSLKMIFDDYKMDIIMRKFDYRVNNIILSSAMEYYCSINNVDFKENIEEDINSSRYDDVIKLYYKDIRNFPVLSTVEEQSLVRKAKAGDIEARETFLNSNLKLVLSVAVMFSKRTMDFADIIQEGNIGLMNALDKFDPDKGFKFSTYARTKIISSIGRAIENKGRVIRIPSYMHERIGKYRSIYNELNIELNREPTDEEIAKKLDLTVDQVEEVYKLQIDTISMEYLLSEDLKNDTDLYGKIIPPYDCKTPEDIVIMQELSNLVLRLIDSSNLSDNEKIVVFFRYGLDGLGPRSLEEIGNILKLTRKRISQIEKQALAKLLFSSNIDLVIDYVEDKEETEKMLKELKNVLKSKNNSRVKAIRTQKPLYDYFPKSSKEKVNDVISTLDSYEKSILSAKFGDDYNRLEYSKLERNQYRYFSSILIPKMKDMLARSKSAVRSRRVDN